MTPAACFLALSLSLPAASDDAQRDFEAAQERFLDQDAEQAIALYDAVLARGFEDPSVYYNLGLALEAMHRPIDAIAAYERTLWLQPGASDAAQNLDGLRASLNPPPPAADADATSLRDALGPWLFSLPLGSIAWTAVVLLVLGCTLNAFRWRTATLELALGSVGLAIVATTAALSQEARAVAREGVPLRSGPDARLESTAALIPGERLRVLGEPGPKGFLEVQRVDGVAGFAPTSALIRVDMPRQATE